MVLARNQHYALVRTLRDHGASKSDLARHKAKAAFLLSQFEHLGYNYRMTDIQGALGSSQMDKAGYILDGRTQRARRYDELLKELPWLRAPHVPDYATHSYQSYVCLFAPEEPSMANGPAARTAKRNDARRRRAWRVNAPGYPCNPWS